MQPITVERFVHGEVYGSRFEYEPGILVCVMTTDAARKDAVYRVGGELASHRLRVDILTNRADLLEARYERLSERYDALLGIEDSIPTPRVTAIVAGEWPTP